MDLDAVLARHPELVLVDELAHTNAPGSRHAKRWQDVEDLLEHGIDVLTTVNVQHLASLHDVVERITGVRQQETVPDEVVRRAEQLELVDLSVARGFTELIGGTLEVEDTPGGGLTSVVSLPAAKSTRRNSRRHRSRRSCCDSGAT
jgi:K+-sensing histidine kinase KdpD